MKKDKKMDDKEVQAKRDMLKELRETAMGMMKDDIKGKLGPVKKVSVIADNKEDLEKGLDSAKDLLKSKLMEKLGLSEDAQPESEEPMDMDEDMGEDEEESSEAPDALMDKEEPIKHEEMEKAPDEAELPSSIPEDEEKIDYSQIFKKRKRV